MPQLYHKIMIKIEKIDFQTKVIQFLYLMQKMKEPKHLKHFNLKKINNHFSI